MEPHVPQHILTRKTQFHGLKYAFIGSFSSSKFTNMMEEGTSDYQDIIEQRQKDPRESDSLQGSLK